MAEKYGECVFRIMAADHKQPEYPRQATNRFVPGDGTVQVKSDREQYVYNAGVVDGAASLVLWAVFITFAAGALYGLWHATVHAIAAGVKKGSTNG